MTSSYWDTQTTGQSASVGGTPQTTAQLQSGILPAGFDPAVWSATPGQYPTLIKATLTTVSLDNGNLPSPETINLPPSALPPSTDIFGKTPSFLAQNISLLPLATQNYLTTAVSETTRSFTGDFKPTQQHIDKPFSPSHRLKYSLICCTTRQRRSCPAGSPTWRE